jgi:hypothetical protein
MLGAHLSLSLCKKILHRRLKACFVLEIPNRAVKMNVKGSGRIPVPPANSGALAKVAVIGGGVMYARHK